APGLAGWLQSVAPPRARGTVALAVVPDARDRSLNRQYREKDQNTDVLSFPADDAAGLTRPAPRSRDADRRGAAPRGRGADRTEPAPRSRDADRRGPAPRGRGADRTRPTPRGRGADRTGPAPR